MAKALCHLNVPVPVVLDAAGGYIMEKVDPVIVGAEGVVENGGVIHKIGTNQLAVCTKAQNKPFYVVAESFKFLWLFPLNQQDSQTSLRQELYAFEGVFKSKLKPLKKW
ncbi:Translation initiation factor eIF-2B subunit alpha [Myotis davidii]|uniref:Translation initiation factor eIF-2B subunit alpha n=1 Tax=Myotis davidii TaxID=225400 RepID=L5M847_MYODS|nr:Translation initiation factor eIF-2B subunit alpha [Myotis davidii]